MSSDLTTYNANSIYFDVGRFEHTQRIAGLLAASDVIPPHYRNNASNCFVAVATAMRMNVDPFLYMQKSFVLNGKPGVEAQLLIAALNQSGLIKGRVQYKYSGAGDDLTCTAYATDTETGEVNEYVLSLAEALKVGNASRNPNWRAIPKLMLAYRSATYLIRTYYPEAGMGLSTKDEMEDVTGTPIDVTPEPEKQTKPRARKSEVAQSASQIVRPVVIDTQEILDDEVPDFSQQEIIPPALVVIPEIKVHQIPDQIAADWSRFSSDFVEAAKLAKDREWMEKLKRNHSGALNNFRRDNPDEFEKLVSECLLICNQFDEDQNAIQA